MAFFTLYMHGRCPANDAKRPPEEVAAIKRHRRVMLEIIKRSDDAKGFRVLPKRWIVERTFGWLIQSRRLVRDCEVNICHSESMKYFSMTKRMLARIASQPFFRQPLK